MPRVLDCQLYEPVTWEHTSKKRAVDARRFFGTRGVGPTSSEPLDSKGSDPSPNDRPAVACSVENLLIHNNNLPVLG